MANETTNNNNPAEVLAEPTPQDYINVIQELKRETVSRDRYDAIVQERNSLIETLRTGGTIPGQEVATRRSSAEIRQDLWGSQKKHTECGYVELALELREAVMEEEGEDIFVAKGHHITPTAEAYASAQKTADIYRECLDYANGDDTAFINELNRRMVDTPMANINNKNRRK